MSDRLRRLLVAYDVETVTSAGRRRLQRVAQTCCAHGVRVQKSVFECVLPIPDVVRFVDTLARIMDRQSDSIRVYYLGPAMASVEVYGRSGPLNPREPMVV